MTKLDKIIIDVIQDWYSFPAIENFKTKEDWYKECFEYSKNEDNEHIDKTIKDIKLIIKRFQKQYDEEILK